MEISRFLFFSILICCVLMSFSFIAAYKVFELDEIPQGIIVDELVMPVPFEYSDYDNDGNLDLIRKERDGKIYVYLNKNTNDKPVYREGQLYEGEEIVFKEVEKQEASFKTLGDIIELNYNRFDVRIPDDYYYNNEQEILDFLDNFEERFNELESFTGWSTEEMHGTRLLIFIQGTTGGCYGGQGSTAGFLLTFSEPLYMEGCQRPYYVNDTPYFDNPGELGDWWPYMGVALHEATHTIGPAPILYRRWITEGFAEYNEYNILSNYNGNGYLDIPQETSDYYLYQGTNYYNWEDYVANDYHDTSSQCDGQGCILQESNGYDITAWMWSMLRDDYSLFWNDFFSLMCNNLETLDKAWELGGGGIYSYFTDAHVLDVFGRSLDWDFETETKPVFRYDGPTGPGWGVRIWEPLDWYADLIPTIEFDRIGPVYVGENVNIDVVIYNNGDTDVKGVEINVYDGADLFGEYAQPYVYDIDAHSSILIEDSVTSDVTKIYNFIVKVDEENIKIETNEFNNDANAFLVFQRDCRPYFDKKKWEWINPCEFPEIKEASVFNQAL